MKWRSRFLYGFLFIASTCTAGVPHSVQVILPMPHKNAETGEARQTGNLFFYTDRNVPETVGAYNALVSGKAEESLNILSSIDAANLPGVQRAYWQNDVAVCFILAGRYKEADELLIQASVVVDEESIRHNQRVGIYLKEAWRLKKESQEKQKAEIKTKDAPK